MNFFFSLIVLFFCISTYSQDKKYVNTDDIDNFWNAYDSIQKVKNFDTKIDIINNLYIKNGSKGLKAFMKVRNYSDTLWVNLIKKFPKFWNSVRTNTLKVKSKSIEIEKAVSRFKELYPDLKESEMYFTIGGLRSGGTTMKNLVLIGAEIAVADSLVDVSEFKNNWLPNVFKKQSLDNIVFLNIHEYVHTQQNYQGKDVLSESIREGACDFIAELIINTPYKSQYMIYGINNEEEIKKKFKEDMNTKRYENWLSNGSIMGEKADLGYFIGYKICKNYYDKFEDKSLAVKNIIELDYSNKKKVLEFLEKAKYF